MLEISSAVPREADEVWYGVRDRPTYVMANGTNVRLASAEKFALTADTLTSSNVNPPGLTQSGEEPLQRGDLLAVATAGVLSGGERNATVSLAAPLTVGALAEAAPQLLSCRKLVFWAPAARAVVARRQRCIGALVVEVPRLQDNLLKILKRCLLLSQYQGLIEGMPYRCPLLRAYACILSPVRGTEGVRAGRSTVFCTPLGC